MRWDWRQLIELRLWLAPSCCCCCLCREQRWRWVSAGSRRLCLLADMIALPAGKTLINCYHHLFISACSRFSFPVWAHHHVSFCPVFCHSRRCLHILCSSARRRAVLPVDVSVSPLLSASLFCSSCSLDVFFSISFFSLWCCCCWLVCRFYCSKDISVVQFCQFALGGLRMKLNTFYLFV